MEIEIIVDECLENIRNQRASIADCLAKYPEHAAELKALLKTALAIQATPEVAPSDAFALKTRTRILRLAQPKAARRFSFPRPQFAFASAAFAAMILTVAVGMVFVSSDSLPGSPLYPIKREVEAFQILLARDDETQIRLRMLLASQRLKEAATLSNSGKTELTEQAFKEYGAEVNAAVSKIQTQPQPKPILASEVTNQLTRQQNEIHGIQTKVPAPAVQNALNANAQALDQVSAINAAPVTARTTTPTSTRTSLPPAATASLTATFTRTPITATSTMTPTVAATISPTLTITPTVTATISPTATATRATLTATTQPTVVTPSATVAVSITPTRTITTTITPSVTPTRPSTP